MVDFRYAQYCPLTRAVEILGERWTVLILRELFLGPKRFRDLKGALGGISPSVLADRLTKLEEKGIVAHRELPPPSGALVYELHEAGRALQPLLAELTRWGLRFLGSPGPGDSVRPEWLCLGLQTFARREPGAKVGLLLHIAEGKEAVDLYVGSGEGGTTVSRTPAAWTAKVSGPPTAVLLLASGLLVPGADGPGASLKVEGDPAAASLLPSLFDFRPTPASPPATPGFPANDHIAPRRQGRRGKRPAATSGLQGATPA